MSIVYELRQWEGGVYYFLSTAGKTPICKVYPSGDGWEVLFFRGPANLGPYHYGEFEHAKRHLFRYLVPREDELMGEPNNWGAPGAVKGWAEPQAIPAKTQHPRRRRDRHWATRHA